MYPLIWCVPLIWMECWLAFLAGPRPRRGAGADFEFHTPKSLSILAGGGRFPPDIAAAGGEGIPFPERRT